jgi:FixJ family two-component response regulator
LLAAVELRDDERAQLESWTRRRTRAQALALRPRIVLLAAGGATNSEIAGRLGVHRNMVANWRSRFLEHRLDGWSMSRGPGGLGGSATSSSRR